MSFMQPQLDDCGYWEVETDIHETEYIPADLVTYAAGEIMSVYDFADYVSGTPTGAILRKGFIWRFSAPGYMDCTDWTPADSPADAVRDILSMHGDTLDESDLNTLASWLDSFDEFWRGYLLALAFTGNDWSNVKSEHNQAGTDDNPEPLYSNPGGQIGDVVDIDEFQSGLPESDRIELLSDCLAFYCDAFPMISDRENEAGADFHFTRNGHGCGFGDWDEFGDRLTELAKPYGTAEVERFNGELSIHN